MAITKVRIHPAIGIARMGNSPTDFFIGPEVPGRIDPPPDGHYKDPYCRLKRQAARFRIFGYDANDNLVREITSADAQITWTVEVANLKAYSTLFRSTPDVGGPRNSWATGVARDQLKIVPGPRTLVGPDQTAAFDTGTFMGINVPLGDARTDEVGRLVVLGGFGRSGSSDGSSATVWSDNDNWYDDVSDGPVGVQVKLNGTASSLSADAWVICPPPDFAPTLVNMVTLYDAVLDLMIQGGRVPPIGTPSFNQHIYPILKRALDAEAVIKLGMPRTYHDATFQPSLHPDLATRQYIVGKLRPPAGFPANSGDMPKLYNDQNAAGLTVTATQYQVMQAWATQNGWTDDWTGAPPAPPAADAITPAGLTRAALEACAGGGFYPGIEASWQMRNYTYSEPFRLSGLQAGEVTRHMALPWQADFTACTEGFDLAWWPAQRPDMVLTHAGGTPVAWTRGLVASHDDMVANVTKLGLIVDDGSGHLVETERHVACSGMFIVTDKNEYGSDEVAGRLVAGSPAVFSDAIYVIVEGIAPADLGITTATPSAAQLLLWAPNVTLWRSDGSQATAPAVNPRGLLLQDPTLPLNQPQRCTFDYSVDFTDVSPFSPGGTPSELQILQLRAHIYVTASDSTFLAEGEIELRQQPDPYMIDGATSWLSTDLRVFKVRAGDTAAAAYGVAVGTGASAPLDYIGALLGHFNSLPDPGHPFETIPTDENTNPLELGEAPGGTRAYNFAIARVRYQAKVNPAPDIRVFFRLFRTAATGTDFQSGTTYRSTSGLNPFVVPLLGIQGGEIVTIPCLATGRVDPAQSMATQPEDGPNTATLPATSAEVHRYFGCWLDFNQTTPRFPTNPSPVDGGWTSGLKSIQDLIRGFHQCLVAEIYLKNQPIATGATPANSDRLSQRNLAIVDSDNPGSVETRTVQHTFEIRATAPLPRERTMSVAATEIWTAQHERSAALAARAAGLSPESHVSALRTQILEATGPWVEMPGPDELMIVWSGLPRGTSMTVYMPDVSADEVLRVAGQSMDVPSLERIDGHTIRCLEADVTYIPLPSGRQRNIPALLTVELPEAIKYGQNFKCVVHQVSGTPRHVIGTFQVGIPVRKAGELVRNGARRLSVLRHIARSMEPDDLWAAIFQRYLRHEEERLKSLGVDPEGIKASPDGDPGPGYGGTSTSGGGRRPHGGGRDAARTEGTRRGRRERSDRDRDEKERDDHDSPPSTG